MTIEECLYFTQLFVGGWAVMSALEWLANKRLFQPKGLLSWSVLRLRTASSSQAKVGAIFGSTEIFVLLQYIRILAGLILLVFHESSLSVIAFFILFCTCGYMNYRACFGGDGSDQMGAIVAVGGLLMSLGVFFDDRHLAYSGVVLTSGQGLLAYFVAGASKIISPVWRSGAAVRGVMHTTTFGNVWAAGVTSTRPITSFFVGWLVMLTEISFPVVLFAPPWLLACCLIGFAVFHFSNAYFMGLNSFVLSFVATYPSIVKVNFDIRHLLQ